MALRAAAVPVEYSEMQCRNSPSFEIYSILRQTAVTFGVRSTIYIGSAIARYQSVLLEVSRMKVTYFPAEFASTVHTRFNDEGMTRRATQDWLLVDRLPMRECGKAKNCRNRWQLMDAEQGQCIVFRSLAAANCAFDMLLENPAVSILVVARVHGGIAC